ncbi:MAG: recombination protein NinG [Bacteroidales bacterium]
MKKQSEKSKLDYIFSLFIRMRDSKASGFKSFVCISCGRVKTFRDGDNGHYISRVHTATRFNEMNCNMQCIECNRFSGGEPEKYRIALVNRYGEEAVKELESLKNTTVKYSEYEYKELTLKYKRLIKQMEE